MDNFGKRLVAILRDMALNGKLKGLTVTPEGSYSLRLDIVALPNGTTRLTCNGSDVSLNLSSSSPFDDPNQNLNLYDALRKHHFEQAATA
jgi:hypothetical protein